MFPRARGPPSRDTNGLRDRLTDADALARVEALRPIADRLGCSMSQLAIAWCTRHSMVSSVITGASRVEQVRENFGALEVMAALDDSIAEEMVAALS